MDLRPLAFSRAEIVFYYLSFIHLSLQLYYKCIKFKSSINLTFMGAKFTFSSYHLKLKRTVMIIWFSSAKCDRINNNKYIL